LRTTESSDISVTSVNTKRGRLHVKLRALSDKEKRAALRLSSVVIGEETVFLGNFQKISDEFITSGKQQATLHTTN